MYPVAVVLQYTQKITRTRTQDNTQHTKLQTQCTQNYKHNVHKITNGMFHPNKEPKVQ